MHRNLLVDVNNYVFSMRFSILKTPKTSRAKERNAKEVIFLECLKGILRHAKTLKADAVVMCVDSPNVWRKDLYPLYKAKDDVEEDPYKHETIAAADMLCSFMKEYTAAYVVSCAKCEADDIIAVWCQESFGCENVILSTDKDYVQLLNKRTLLYNPVKKEFRTSDDPQYDLFLKCIRGDPSDNIRSAYPKIREDKLKAAWADELTMLNLLETVLPSGEKVADKLEFNFDLIDLSSQPQNIRKNIFDNIIAYTPSKYNQLGVMRFFGENGLKDASGVLDYKDAVLKSTPKFRQ